MAIPVFAFAAYSGTGKTTVIENLVRALKAKGLRTAVIKHDGHGFEVDRAGKDSARFTRAGAQISMISSAEKTAMVEVGEKSIEELIAMVRGVDVLLVEGWKNGTLPQIGVARKAAGGTFTAPLARFEAVVCDFAVQADCPCFTLDDTEGLAEFIMNRIDGQKDFTHFNAKGQAKMVDVGEKPLTARTAVAAGRVLLNPETFALVQSGGVKKGDVLGVAQIAGVMGAKRTPELIPLCHPVAIDGVDLTLRLDAERCSVEIEAAVSCCGRTGVEMEALSAVSVAALTVYDMCKAVQRDVVISDVRLLEKTGGVHGDFRRKE